MNDEDDFTGSKLVHDILFMGENPKLIFNLHRRIQLIPIIKRYVTVEELMRWDPSPLKESLCFATRKSKDSIKSIDKIITEILTAEKESTSIDVQRENINGLLHIGLFQGNGIFGDEIYLQIIRRINGIKSQSADDLKCLWKLMICVTASFPPSKGLSPFVLRWLDQFESDLLMAGFIKKVMKHCHCNLNVFQISGPRGYSTTLEDVQFWYDEAGVDKVPIFGIELDEIYLEAELVELMDELELKVPKIVIKLIEMIKKLDGFKKKGIFRISGNVQQVFRLKVLLSNDVGIDNFDSIKDPLVPGSTLKLWMRVLRSPLIPDNLYQEFLDSRLNPTRTSSLLETDLPKCNYAVISYICKFLIELAEPINQEFTKMTLDNFSMIFAPCFMRCPLTASTSEILENSQAERQVISEIFNHFISVKQ